jgi:hypothetical protein
MFMRNRNGKVAGILVLILLLILLPVWAFGHWVLGKYPAAGAKATVPSNQVSLESSGLDQTGVAQPDLSSGGIATGSAGSQNSAEMADLSGSAYVDREPGQSQVTQEATQELKAKYEQLAAETKMLQEEREASLAEMRRIASENQAISDENQQLQNELRGFQRQVSDQSGRLQSAQRSIADLKTQLIVMQSAANPKAPSNTIARQRKWRSTSGRIVPATFEGLQDDVVLLSTRGKTFRVPLNKLIAEDQAIAKQLSQQDTQRP